MGCGDSVHHAEPWSQIRIGKGEFLPVFRRGLADRAMNF
jgi:hypothetical protein